jgi:hypothetical protein
MARGTRGRQGILSVRAGNILYSTANNSTTAVTVRDPYLHIGSWEVSGAGAGSGIGFCG